MQSQTRMVMPSRSYLSQVEMPITFGLGDVDRLERLDIVWPDGTRQSINHPRVDQTLTIVQTR
jgi:enediyne biosynthesis protein E4